MKNNRKNAVNAAMKGFSKLTMIDRVLLLTHTDMDGSAAAVLLRAAFSRHGLVDVRRLSNSVAGKVIKEAACDEEIAGKYDAVVVCDISCSEEDAEFIDRNRRVKKFVLLDHHATALPLNRYDWALVEPMLIQGTYRSDTDVLRLFGDYAVQPVHSSGTSLMYDYLCYCGLSGQLGNVFLAAKLTFLVAGYDTWDWKTVYGGNCVFEKLNTLFFEYGARTFEDQYVDRIVNGSQPDIFNELDEHVLRVAAAKKEDYRESVARTFSTGTVLLGGRKYSFVFCYTTKYLSDTFDVMMRTYPGADLFLIDRGNGISIRSAKDDIDAGAIAKMAGGGGHPGAGGVNIPFERRKWMLESVLGTQLDFD